jgi:serralysin
MSVFDAREQLFLELVNRARMNPAGEAARFGINLNAGLAAGTLNTAPKQVLAPNTFLEASAAAHSLDMLNHDYFSHTGRNGSSAGARMASAGYGPAGSFGWGENIAWVGTTGTLNANAEVFSLHQNLFLSAGHRVNLLNDGFQEVGIGTSAGVYSSDRNYNALMGTQNFAYGADNGAHVTGVHYTDSDNNDFYSIGEADGGRQVRVYKAGVLVGSCATAAAGGYSAEVTATGAVEVVFSGGGLAAARGAKITLGTTNVKIDLVNDTCIESNVSTSLSQGSGHLRLLGISAINGVGNGYSNWLIGNAAANSLYGYNGNDVLVGGYGNDRLFGHVGDDTLRGDAGNDVLCGSTGSDKFQFLAAGFGDDRISDYVDGVDKLVFNDAFVDRLADLTITHNGTTAVTVAIGTDSIIVQGTSAITINSGDLLFI